LLWETERKSKTKKEIKRSKDLNLNGRLLKCVRSTMEGLGLDLSGSGQEHLAGCCGQDDEPS